jgi:hypothetical protein
MREVFIFMYPALNKYDTFVASHSCTDESLLNRIESVQVSDTTIDAMKKQKTGTKNKNNDELY